MSFTSEQYITIAFDEAQLAILIGDKNENLIQAIAQADNIITAYTGITPSGDPSENNKTLVNVATSIVVWILSGRQGIIAKEELDRRKMQYDDAIAMLDKIKNGEILLASPTKMAAFGKCDRRVEGW